MYSIKDTLFFGGLSLNQKLLLTAIVFVLQIPLNNRFFLFVLSGRMSFFNNPCNE